MRNRFEQVHHSMDLEEDTGMLRRGWIAKPAGQVLILIGLVLGALGLFGHGVLSRQVLRQGTAIVQFDRFARNHGQMDLQVSTTGVAGRSAISFPLQYIQGLKVESIVPEPEASFIRSGQVWYVFEAEQNLLAHFYVKPQTAGNLHGAVWVNDQFIPISHFIYP